MQVSLSTKYGARNYEAIKAWFLEYAKVYLPEMTDFNSSNPFIRLIEFNAYTMEMVHRYTNYYANETFIQTVKKFESGYYIANNFSYRIKGARPADVELTFTLPSAAVSPVLIPQYTEVKTQANLIFQTNESVTIGVGQTTAKVWAKQQVKYESIVFFANGLPNYSIALEEKIVDENITVKVAGDIWYFQNTLSYSNPDDKHFTAGLNINQVMEIRFGDGTNGKIPENGVPIQVTYYITEGILGIVSELAINEIVSSGLPSGITVTNTEPSNGGADQETLTDLRKNIPLFNRTKERAVTKQDFVDVANQHTGVAKSSVLYENGKPVELFIAPKSGGVANNTLLTEVAQYMDLRKVAVELIVRSIGIFRLEWTINITAKRDAINSEVALAVKEKVADFFSVNNQETSGTLYFSQFYSALQNVTVGGVVAVETVIIQSVVMRPYPRPTATATPLNWTASVATTSSGTRYYRITFTGASTYQVRRSTDKVSYSLVGGTYTVGSTYTDTWVTFTISGTYVNGYVYEFASYEYLQRFNQILQLDEPSMLLSTENDANVTVTGGL